jgi:nucleoside-diphosphate-sugar epimerase/glycine cleavage system H lipoate-binding protein
MNERLPSILVTGASGFIGRHFVIAVSEKLRLFCIARRGQKEVGIPYHDNIHWLQVDITNRKNLLNVYNYIKDKGGADYVLHLAGYYDFTLKENPAYEQINITGTRYILEMSKLLGIKRFIFSSSLAACKFPPHGKALTEESPADADFPYARSKRSAEKMIREYSEDFPCSIVRLAAVYSDWCEYPMLYMLLKYWLSGNKLMSRIVTGYGESAVPYIHIKDIIKLFLRIIEISDILPRLAIYNASPQESVSHNELFEAVTRYYYGRGFKSFRVSKFLAFLGLVIISFLGRLNSQKTLEQPWMADYIDKKLSVNASATYNALGWKPTPRYHILRRLLILTEKVTSHPNDWTFRNEILLQRVVYRKSITIYDILTELRELLVEKIVEEIMKPENEQRFPNYRKMGPETLKWYVTLNYQLVTATVRSRDRSIIPAYAREIAYKRHFDGFGVKEVRDLWLLIGNTMKESLLTRPELKDSKQRVDDYIILTSQLAADEFEDTYEILEDQLPDQFASIEEVERLTSIENLKKIVGQLEGSNSYSLTNRASVDLSFKDYGVLIKLRTQVSHPSPFDHAMINAMGDKDALNKTEKAENWAKHVKTKYKITSTPCIHFLSGRIASPEECSGDYMCHHCAVHKLLNEESQMEITDKPEYKNVSGYKMIEDYHYYFGHSWVNIENFRRVRIGIDDFISKILGRVDEINLPPVGAVMKRAEIGCILTRNDKKAPMQSPMSGTVCAVNDKVKKNPELVHDDPYHEGWLYILDSENFKPELAGLYFGRECFQWMEKESQNLYKLMGPRYEQLSATGGELVDDIFGEFPEISWNLLLRTFFHTTEKR